MLNTVIGSVDEIKEPKAMHASNGIYFKKTIYILFPITFFTPNHSMLYRSVAVIPVASVVPRLNMVPNYFRNSSFKKVFLVKKKIIHYCIHIDYSLEYDWWQNDE